MAGLDCGWVMLPQAVIGCTGERPIIIDVVLLHPARGVALLESPPNWTPDATERLRRRLSQARFAAIFPGTLPVLHTRLQRGALSGLPQLLAAGFAAQPPLDLPGGDAWMAAVRRALLTPADAAASGRVAGRGGLLAAAGLVLAGALGGAYLAWQSSPPQAQAGPTVLLAHLATGVAVPAEASAALPSAESPGALPNLPEAAPVEDARAVAFTEALPPGMPAPPPLPPDLLAAPAIPPLPPAPPDPPSIAAPQRPALQPAPRAEEAPPREAVAPSTTRPAPEPVVPPSAAPAVARQTEPVQARRPPVDPAVLAGLLRRGDALLALGDVSAARRFYERAAEAGSAAGARAAGRTHDPAVLAGLGVRGIRPDPEAAAEWYRRADALAAQERP